MTTATDLITRTIHWAHCPDWCDHHLSDGIDGRSHYTDPTAGRIFCIGQGEAADGTMDPPEVQLNVESFWGAATLPGGGSGATGHR